MTARVFSLWLLLAAAACAALPAAAQMGQGSAQIGGAGGGASTLVPTVTKSGNYTVASTDMGGVINLTGAFTLTVPAISGSVLALGQQVCVANVNAAAGGVWTISSTPTINGYPTTLPALSVYPGGGGCLVSNGTSLDWQPGTPGNTGTQHISTQTASASSSLDFTGLTGAYNTYLLDCNDLLPATDAVQIIVRYGTGGTPTYQTTNYAYASIGRSTAAASTSTNTTTGVGLQITSTGIGNAATMALASKVWIHALGSSTHYKSATFQTVAVTSAGNYEAFSGGGAWIGATDAVTALRVMATSGNLASGQCSLYGKAHP